MAVTICWSSWIGYQILGILNSADRLQSPNVPSHWITQLFLGHPPTTPSHCLCFLINFGSFSNNELCSSAPFCSASPGLAASQHPVSQLLLLGTFHGTTRAVLVPAMIPAPETTGLQLLAPRVRPDQVEPQSALGMSSCTPWHRKG